jgi:DNA-binding MarR family transcriptional regulator
MPKDTKREKVAELIAAYRANGNQDAAFDAVAARRLGVSPTDLHCLNIIQARDGVTAGELASASGLTTGAVTGVIDRLERVGYARRARDREDRRRVNVKVTDRFLDEAGEIWGPLAAEWQTGIGRRFSAAELEVATRRLRETEAIGARHLRRLEGDA